jgi:hypothetical protein
MSKSPPSPATLEALRQEADASFQRLGPEAALFNLPKRLRVLKERRALPVGDPQGKKLALQELALRPAARGDLAAQFAALNAWFAQLEAIQARHLGPINPDDSVAGPAPEAIEIRGRALILHRWLGALSEYHAVLNAMKPDTVPAEQAALAVVSAEVRRTRDRLSAPDAFVEAYDAYEAWLAERWKPFEGELKKP